jgi:RNA recognition motif-containing protein
LDDYVVGCINIHQSDISSVAGAFLLLSVFSSRATAKQRDTRKRGTAMQGTKLFVGNLSYSVDREKLRELFAEYGEVANINVIEGKGFGFVEMATREGAEKAKAGLNGTQLQGRTLNVDEARPQRDKDRGKRGGGPRRY